MGNKKHVIQKESIGKHELGDSLSWPACVRRFILETAEKRSIILVCPLAGQALHFCLDTKTMQKSQGCESNAKFQVIPLKKFTTRYAQTLNFF